MNEKYKKNFIRAGELAREVRSFGKSLLVRGAFYNDVIAQVNRKIASLGAIPAFPPQIALNNVAAHFLPQPDQDIIFLDQVVKLDIGVCFEGAIGDCAVTVDLSGHFQPLIDAAEDALLSAEKILKVGLPIREIGKVIQERITARGFKPIKNLSGHGLGLYRIHMPPCIPNYDDSSQGVIKPGMTFAIEPFATNGKGLIYDAGDPTIFSFIKERPVKSEIGRKLLKKMKAFKGLPFAIHDLGSEEYSLAELQGGIAELLKNRVIDGYPPLLEQGKGMVAQAENSVLVDNDGRITITTR